MTARRVLSAVDPYLVAILATVVIATLAPARGAAGPFFSNVATVAIGLLFFLYGTRLSPQLAWEGMRAWRLHLTVFGISFVLFPLLGLAARVLEPAVLPKSLYVGILFLCILPSTVQSSIAFTSIAKGNVAAAICSATFSNLAGIVLTPVLAALLLSSTASFSAASVLRIVLQLLLPFALGQLARPIIGPFVLRHPTATGLADRGSVLLVIYSAFSEGVIAGIWHQVSVRRLLALVATDAALLAIVLCASTVLARELRFPRADRITIIFCGSKKSLATGIPMAAVLFGRHDTSLVVLPLMLFHQIQLMVCAVLARRFGRQVQITAPVERTPESSAP